MLISVAPPPPQPPFAEVLAEAPKPPPLYPPLGHVPAPPTVISNVSPDITLILPVNKAPFPPLAPPPCAPATLTVIDCDAIQGGTTQV